jgi:hypothetical protein
MEAKAGASRNFGWERRKAFRRVFVPGLPTETHDVLMTNQESSVIRTSDPLHPRHLE